MRIAFARVAMPWRTWRPAEDVNLVFLKERFDADAAAFSFSESDLGIDVRQTAREHAELIKTPGQHFASRGLAAKLLSGDTSGARPVDFTPGANAPMKFWLSGGTPHGP